MKKQKVLLVHNYYQIPGGEDTVVVNEKRLLEKNGHEVILYTRHNSELRKQNMFQKMLLPFSTLFNLRTYREIKQIIRQEAIEIVHVHNTLNLISPAVYYAAVFCKVPVVQTMHNFRLLCPGATFYRDGHICEDCLTKGLYCAIKHRCYRGSRVQTLACVISTKIHRWVGIYGKLNYICLTEFNREKLLRLRGISLKKVFVKPNFVSAEGMIVPESDRKKRYIFAGRIDKLKGIDILLEAWKQMGKNAPELLICGTGPMEAWCDDFIRVNRLTMVKRLGFVKNKIVRELLSDSKALILPTQWYEGFPMSIVEAFSVGTPVICSNLGNVGSVVQEGVNGCKFSVDRASELVEAIGRCHGIYESTFAEYKKHYREESNYQCLANIYCEVCK